MRTGGGNHVFTSFPASRRIYTREIDREEAMRASSGSPPPVIYAMAYNTLYYHPLRLFSTTFPEAASLSLSRSLSFSTLLFSPVCSFVPSLSPGTACGVYAALTRPISCSEVHRKIMIPPWFRRHGEACAHICKLACVWWAEKKKKKKEAGARARL